MTPQQIQGLIIPVGFLVVFYLFAIRPQKKKEKEIREMRDSLSVGDEVITIGGIYGKILLCKEDKITLEVGTGKTRIDVTRWAISSIIKSRGTKEE